MPVININILESSAQIVSGIPKTVTLSTNVPSTIFYTLDGTEPSVSSAVYVSPIRLPIDKPSVTLSIFATNGVDVSPIIIENYTSDILNNTRLPHSAMDGYSGKGYRSNYPFGTGPDVIQGPYTSPGDAGYTVDNPDLPATPTTLNADGYPAAFTNLPYNIENYEIIYSTTNWLGETGPGIGTLPGKVEVEEPTPDPEETEQFTKLFNPKAYVIFQDFSKENPDDPPQINRQFFSSEDPNKVRDGNNYYNVGLDAPTTTGAFLRSHYNPRDNTITYYYYDSAASRWIISKTPYQPNGSWDGNLSGIKFSRREKGANFVFEWVQHPRRILF